MRSRVYEAAAEQISRIDTLTHAFIANPTGFKFNQNLGRQELIKGIAGGDANKKKYFSGCCQFIKEAKKVRSLLILFWYQDFTWVILPKSISCF